MENQEKNQDNGQDFEKAKDQLKNLHQEGEQGKEDPNDTKTSKESDTPQVPGPAPAPEQAPDGSDVNQNGEQTEAAHWKEKYEALEKEVAESESNSELLEKAEAALSKAKAEIEELKQAKNDADVKRKRAEQEIRAYKLNLGKDLKAVLNKYAQS